MITALEARKALTRRLDKLNDIIEGALLRGEGRRPHEIEAAVAAVTRWITAEEGIEELLTADDAWIALTWEYSEWVKSGTPISVALNLPDQPEWEYQEIFAVVALVYAQQARQQIASNSAKGTALAAIAYAEATEHYDSWKEVRGQARCRNPWDLMARLANERDRLTSIPFVKKARSELGKRGARASLDRDPRQKLKAEIHDEWKRRRLKGPVNASKFALEMHQKHEGKIAIGSLKNMQTKWATEYHPAR